VTKSDSPTRRRILARKAALASIAGLATAAGACGHEPQTVTVEPVATASAATPTTATHVVQRPPPPPPEDDDLVLRHPMHGSDPVGPPIVRPTPPPWSTLLGKLSVSSKPATFRGKSILEITIVLADPLRWNEQPIELNVSGGGIVKPTFQRGTQGSQSVILSVEPSHASHAGPVQIMIGVLDRAGGRIGHARFEVSGTTAKVTQLDN
jgi:hypothetical protein